MAHDDPHDRSDQQEDDHLLAQLRALAAALDPVPADALFAARSQLAYRRLDADLAELTFDSALAPEPAGVRSGVETARRLSFEAGSTQVEVEILLEGDRRRLVGQCVPATEVSLTVRCLLSASPIGEVVTKQVTTDDLGRFSVDVPAGAVSLRCVWTHTELAVETAWVSV